MDIFFRLSRPYRSRTFWLFAIASACCWFSLHDGAFYAYAISMSGNYENGGPKPLRRRRRPAIAGAAVWFAMLARLFIRGSAVIVKRLHDRDKSAWWLLCSSFAECFVVMRPKSCCDRMPIRTSNRLGIRHVTLAIRVGLSNSPLGHDG